MPTISKQQYDEDVKALPSGTTEQGYVRGLLRNGYEIEGLNLSQTSKSYLETSDPTKYSTQDLQNVIGKPEGMIGAVGKGILGGVVGSAQAIYNMGRNAYNLVDHPLNAITAVPAIAAGAVEEGLAGLAAGGYKLATGNTIPEKYSAPETGSREAFRGFSKSIGLTDVAKGIVNVDPSQVLTGVDTGINFSYQNPDVAAMTAEGGVRGFNKKFGTDLTTPIEAGGKIVNTAKNIAPKASNFLPWRSKTPNLDASIKESINQALRPSVMKSDAQANKYYDNAITATKDIASNKEFIELQDPNGGFMPKGSLPDSLETMKQANIQMKNQLYGKWNNLTKMATGKGAMADVQPIIDKYIEFANDKIMQTQYPELATWAETKASAFSNLGMIAPDQLQKMIQNWNSELDAYYKNPNPNDVSKTAVIAAVKNTANDVLSNMVENQSVPLEYQGLFSELKKKYASQKAIEADLNRRATVFARQNPQSLLDYSNILTVRDAVTALSQLDFKSLARGAATKLMTSWMKEQNNPNIMIKKMFQNIDSHIKSSSENPILQRAQEAITLGESKVGSPNTVNGLETLPDDILNPTSQKAKIFKSGTPPVKTGAGVDNSIGRSVDLSSVNVKTNPSVTKTVGLTPQSQQSQSLPNNLAEPSKAVNTANLSKKFPTLTPEEIANLTPEERATGLIGGSDTLYHGTSKGNVFSDFNSNKAGTGNGNNINHQGDVVYLTDSKKAADYFSTQATRNAKLRDRSLPLDQATGGVDQVGEVMSVKLSKGAKVKDLNYRPTKAEVDAMRSEGWDAVSFPEEAFNAKDLAGTDVSGLQSRTIAVLNKEKISTLPSAGGGLEPLMKEANIKLFSDLSYRAEDMTLGEFVNKFAKAKLPKRVTDDLVKLGYGEQSKFSLEKLWKSINEKGVVKPEDLPF